MFASMDGGGSAKALQFINYLKKLCNHPVLLKDSISEEGAALDIDSDLFPADVASTAHSGTPFFDHSARS